MRSLDDGAHPFHPSLPKNPCGLHSYSSKGRPHSHLLGWRALCRQHPSLLKNSLKQRFSRRREDRAHILRSLPHVQTEHASRHPRSRIWTVLGWLGTYRTASACVFTPNTHSRSRIWTVLDGKPYAAALRRRQWEYTAPHPYSRIWTVLRGAVGLTLATAHTDGL